MIAILFVLVLVIVLAIVLPPSPTPHRSGPPPGWEPPEEREARLRTEAIIAGYPARHRAFVESQRPTILARDMASDRVLLEWPDGRKEWMSRIEIAAKDLRPKVLVC